MKWHTEDLPTKQKKRRFTRHKGRKGSKAYLEAYERRKAEICTRQSAKNVIPNKRKKYLRARGDAKQVEKEGIMMPIKKTAWFNDDGYVSR